MTRDTGCDQPAPDAATVAALRRADALTLLLDYDGTLVPLAQRPELAAPDADLEPLLRGLIQRPGLDLHIVSGRLRATLDHWFGKYPISLWAEHGFWHRPAHRRRWRPQVTLPDDWSAPVRQIVERVTASTPGSFYETKSSSIAWHYRLAPASVGPRAAAGLQDALRALDTVHGLEVLAGRKVIEVRVPGVTKGLVARHLCDVRLAGPLVAIGDDRTDEDLFAALPDTAVTITVGSRPSRARFRLPDAPAVRTFLARLLP